MHMLYLVLTELLRCFLNCRVLMLQLSIHIQKVVFCDQFATLSFALRADGLVRNLRVVVIDGGSLILTVR